MNIAIIIKIIGIVCFLLHGRFHAKVCDVTYPGIVGDDGCEAQEVQAERWMCRRCNKSWEVVK